MHRFVLAEANTHRVFSRNSASSRAIPLQRQLDRVGNDPAMPVVWPMEKPGMSGGEPLPYEVMKMAQQAWLAARVHAVDIATTLGDLGLHKSVVNRLLEPFMWHTVVITSTAWENFRGLRVNPAAQPEFQAVAAEIMAAIDASTPTLVYPGQWHLPYIVKPDDITAVEEYLLESVGQGNYGRAHVTRGLINVSTSRVAAVSYVRQGEPREIKKDYDLYTRLTNADPMHASPLEHVCTPNERNQHYVEVTPFIGEGGQLRLHLPRYGNLIGWHSHRFDVEALRQYQAFA